MRATIIKNLNARFAAYGEMIRGIDDPGFAARVDVPKHKPLEQHLWCVVGARESYAKALRAGGWAGSATR